MNITISNTIVLNEINCINEYSYIKSINEYNCICSLRIHFDTSVSTNTIYIKLYIFVSCVV